MSIFNDCEQLNLFGMTEEDVVKDSLNDKYIIPPFSVFDSKQEYWLSRKRLWMKLGIKSELGRNAKTFSMKDWADKKKEQGKIKEKSLPSDTSIFDPVLCEICYKWFNVKNGNILDPFAGGSVRGIVAGYLGYNYIGIDLSKEQIEANNANAEEIFGRDRYDKRNNIKWINDDSMNVGNYIKDESADLIFTCPPYFDLEIYSDKKEDLSNMSFDDFVVSYSEILKRCATKLKNNRFAVVVIGDVRDKNGAYRNLIDITKKAFHDCGLVTWNEIILLNALSSAGIRAETPFLTNRKVTKVHQNVLVFYKGNPKEIRNNYDKDMDV